MTHYCSYYYKCINDMILFDIILIKICIIPIILYLTIICTDVYRTVYILPLWAIVYCTIYTIPVIIHINFGIGRNFFQYYIQFNLFSNITFTSMFADYRKKILLFSLFYL